MGQSCVEGLVVRTVSAHLRVRMGQVLYHVACEREGKQVMVVLQMPSLRVLRILVSWTLGWVFLCWDAPSLSSYVGPSLPSWFSRDTGSVSDPQLFAPLCFFLTRPPYHAFVPCRNAKLVSPSPGSGHALDWRHRKYPPAFPCIVFWLSNSSSSWLLSCCP